MSNEQIPVWAQKWMAQQNAIMAEMQEAMATLEIMRAQREVAENPAKKALADDEVSPEVKAVLDEMSGKKPALGDDVSPMVKDVLDQIKI